MWESSRRSTSPSRLPTQSSLNVSREVCGIGYPNLRNPEAPHDPSSSTAQQSHARTFSAVSSPVAARHARHDRIVNEGLEEKRQLLQQQHLICPIPTKDYTMEVDRLLFAAPCCENFTIHRRSWQLFTAGQAYYVMMRFLAVVRVHRFSASPDSETRGTLLPKSCCVG